MPDAPKYPELPSEIPAHFTQVTTSFNYEKRDVMIPMRDGVRAACGHRRAEGREECADPADAHALQRESRR